MSADTPAAGAAYENPLIPNRKLRQIYAAMAQARMLNHALPRAQRDRTVGQEACLVSTSVDLGPGDLVSDTLLGGVVDFLRGATLGAVLTGHKAPASLRRNAALRTKADCGSTGRLPVTAGAAERLWAAIGAASALKIEAARVKKTASCTSGEAAPQLGVVVVYTLPGEAPSAVWRKVLTFAATEVLPIFFVVLPPQPGDFAKTGAVSPIAMTCGVPGIAVDGDDAVAIYRVMQESLGRASAGGGATLMECVPYLLPGAAAKRTAAADAIASIEQYMLLRGVATKRWMNAETRAFAKRLAAGKST